MSGSLSNSKQLLDFWNEKSLDRIEDKPKRGIREWSGTLENVQINPGFLDTAREAGRRIAEAEEREIAGMIMDMTADAGQKIYPGDIVTIGIDTGHIRPASKGEHPIGVALKMSEDGIVTVLHQGRITAQDEGTLFVGNRGSVTVSGKHIGTVENVRIDLARDR